MSYVRVMIHYIWATKNREPIITPGFKKILLPHIKNNCQQKGISLDTINCVEVHIHLMVLIDPEQTISKVAQLIKGESSYWANNQKILDEKFNWQDDYIALSVSNSMVDKVRAYITNQEEHHKSKTFAEEYEAFSKLK